MRMSNHSPLLQKSRHSITFNAMADLIVIDGTTRDNQTEKLLQGALVPSLDQLLKSGQLSIIRLVLPHTCAKYTT